MRSQEFIYFKIDSLHFGLFGEFDDLFGEFDGLFGEFNGLFGEFDE